MLLVSLISYIDRNTLALLIPAIMKETGLTAEQYGFIVAAFSVAYSIANPLWGALIDRMGLRAGMMAAVAFWTLASMGHAFAGGFLGFAIARTALGFGEGATFPGGLRTVVQTLRPAEQARGLAVAYSGGSLGAIVTPLVITPIYLLWGWRPAFLFTGAIGFAWLVLWFFVSRRDDVLRWKPTGKPVARMSFADARIWSFILVYGLGATPLGFVMYAASIYLTQAMGKDQAFLGKVLWIPPLGWEIGYFFWGWMLDRATARGVPRISAVRRLMLVCTVLSLPLAATPWMSETWMVMGEMFFAMFIMAGFIVPSVCYATHVFSAERSGLIAGIGAGSYGAMVALTMPVFGRLLDLRAYAAAFAMAAVAPAIGYAAWAWINRGQR